MSPIITFIVLVIIIGENQLLIKKMSLLPLTTNDLLNCFDLSSIVFYIFTNFMAFDYNFYETDSN